MLHTHSGWTKARQSRVWAATAAAALAVGCNGGDGTDGTGCGALGHVSGLRSLGSGCGGRARHGHGWARARAALARQLVRRQCTTKGLNAGDLGSTCWWRTTREARGDIME